MTLEQLGNLGEFFGSVAVLITLIYLTVQVRFARMDSRAALLQHRNNSARDLWLCTASNERLARSMVKGHERLGDLLPAPVGRMMEEAELTADEAYSVNALASAHFFHRQTLYGSDLTQDERRALDAQLAMFSRGLFGLWFDELRETTGFDQNFVRYVESLRAEAQ